LISQPTSTPRYFLTQALYITYYWLKQFEKKVNLAYSSRVDELKIRTFGARILGISSIFLFFFSFFLAIISPIITAIGIAISIVMFAVASAIANLGYGVETEEYLLWALGHKRLDLTGQSTAKTIRIRGRYRKVTLQPYVKPCNS